MSDNSQVMADMSAPSLQEKRALQQALLESAQLFDEDVARFSQEWALRWSDPARTQELAAISVTLHTALAGLQRECSRPEGPSPPQVSGFLRDLLGTRDAPGPLARLQALTAHDPAAMSLEDQRLLSEVDTLSIQLNGFRAQWQDYLSLVTALERASATTRTGPALPPLPPNPAAARTAPIMPPLPGSPAQEEDEEESGSPAPVAPLLPPVSPAPSFGQNGNLPRGPGSMLKALWPFLLALVVIVFGAYQIVSRAPKAESQATPVPAATSTTLSAPTATPTGQPTAAPTTTPTATAQPSPTATPQPTATASAGGGQLSVNPPVLLLPCPGTGAATLQLANTGAAAFAWQATPTGASGGNAGILLDGAPTERGQLNPGEVTQLSVTAQAANAQGTIAITYTGASTPVTVSYSVNC